MASLLVRLDVSTSALVVTMAGSDDVIRASGNLKKVYTLPVNQLNAEALLSRDTVIFTVDAARWTEVALASDPHGRRGQKFGGATVELDPESGVQDHPDVPEEEAASELPLDDGAGEQAIDDAGSSEDGD